MNWLDCVQWDAQGLVPVIAQEAGSGDVLMVAWMNREALARTVELGEAVYWSRSRQRLWRKGEESGHVQKVHELRLDCDRDVLLLTVTQLGHVPGIACHTGRHSCFFHRYEAGEGGEGGCWVEAAPVLKDPQTIYRPASPASVAEAALPGPSPEAVATSADVLQRLAEVIESRRGGDPDKSYVARLFAKGTDTILKKLGEEATETVLAGKDGQAAQIVYETADLWFHSLVALAHFGLKPADVLAELMRREGLSGLEEFASRARGA